MRLGDFVNLNPKIKLIKGISYAFVEMKDLEPSIRSVFSNYNKEFSGSGSKFECGDTLLARITPCLENGKTSQFKGHSSPAWGSTEFIVLRGIPNKSDNDFIYYFSRSPEFRSYAIQNMVGSSGRQRVPNDAVENYECEFPSLHDQNAIAHILGTLDDKIELNQKMNKILEEIAKAIFKSWFVDFDPVRAKAEGRPTGLSPEISDLFPDAMTDSEIGEIPKGWSQESIYQFCSVEYGAPFKSKLFNEDGQGIPLVRIRDLPKGKSDVFTEEIHPKGTLIKTGDLVVGMDGEFRCYLWRGTDSWMNQRVCKFVPRENVPSTFIWFALERPLHFIESTEVATTVIHLGKGDIDDFQFMRSSQELLDQFSKLTLPLLERMVIASKEIETLAELRDTLLPKLIAGELRIPDAEKLLEEAGI